MPCAYIRWRGWMACHLSVYCDGLMCHILCLYSVTRLDDMACICILWQDGVSCPVFIYGDGVGWYNLCLYSLTWLNGMTCVCILWRDGVSHPVSVFCDGVGWHDLCLYNVTGVVSCPVSVSGDGFGWHALCLYRPNVTGWGVMYNVCSMAFQCGSIVNCHCTCSRATDYRSQSIFNISFSWTQSVFKLLSQFDSFFKMSIARCKMRYICIQMAFYIWHC